jgi:Cytochrome c oxidase assembly protein CtaG/Cox11
LTGIHKVKIFVALIIAIIALTAADKLRAAETAGNMREPAAVTRAYLRAAYARDFAEAYRYVSADDRRVKDLNRYLRQRGPFNGFALEAARTLAALVDIDTTQTQIGANRVLLTARYNAPDPEKFSPLLRQWNGYRLNALSTGERRQIIETIDRKKRDGAMQMIAGEEKLTLIKEDDQWRIFFNWAAGVTIPFRTILAEPAAAVDVSLSRTQVVSEPGEVFEIQLKLKNRSAEPIVTRIGHQVEPKELAEYLEIVQCGFLLPVKLQPGAEQEYSATYLLRGSLPEGVHQLKLTYDFRRAQEK